MSELEFLGALHVELTRHAELHPEQGRHELFQTSTVKALLEGSFDGDVTLAEVLEHGDLGLGTLDGLDGELMVLDGAVWKANVDCTLSVPALTRTTPYAVVVPFSPDEPQTLSGPLSEGELEGWLGDALSPRRPVAIRIDGEFERVHVRSVPKQRRPYPTLAQAIETQHVCELENVRGTMMGFCFPDALDGIEIVGAHLHFITEDRARGGHVLGYVLQRGSAQLDRARELHVELPPAVSAPAAGAEIDQRLLHTLESEE
jgi:acetolactate decarboxylase